MFVIYNPVPLEERPFFFIFFYLSFDLFWTLSSNITSVDSSQSDLTFKLDAIYSKCSF